MDYTRRYRRSLARQTQSSARVLWMYTGGVLFAGLVLGFLIGRIG